MIDTQAVREWLLSPMKTDIETDRKEARQIGERILEALDEIDRLRARLDEIKTAVADYMASEGCHCCRGEKHSEHRETLARLLLGMISINSRQRELLSDDNT